MSEELMNCILDVEALIDPMFELGSGLTEDVVEGVLEVLERNKMNHLANLFKGIDIDSLEKCEAFMDMDAWNRITSSNKRLAEELNQTKIVKSTMSTYQRLLCWDEIDLYRRTSTLGPKAAAPKRKAEPSKKKRSRGGKSARLEKQVKDLGELDFLLKNDEWCSS